jgi:hypothetical protein
VKKLLIHKGSHRSIRQDSSGEFGQVHPASAP